MARANQKKTRRKRSKPLPLSAVSARACPLARSDDITPLPSHVTFTPQEAASQRAAAAATAASGLHTGGHWGTESRVGRWRRRTGVCVCVCMAGPARCGSAQLGLLQLLSQQRRPWCWPRPSSRAACSGVFFFSVTVKPRANAQDFLGGVSLCCGMRSIRAGEGCCLCRHKAPPTPPPPAATLWCCQWCNVELKGRWVRILLPKTKAPPSPCLSQVYFKNLLLQLSTLTGLFYSC